MNTLSVLLIFILVATGSLFGHCPNRTDESLRRALVTPVQTKSSGAIRGRVMDQATQKGLSGVNITIEGTHAGSMTNRDGVFVVSKLAAGTYALTFSLIGYAEVKLEGIEVSANDTTDISVVTLTEQAIPLKEVVVSAGSYSLLSVKPSSQTLTNEDVKMLGWAEDVTRALQRVPGVSGNDVVAKFYIRGGDVDEVLVLLDGMQIYKPFHQKDFGGGLFSTIDVESIEDVDFSTGGFTAEYGDRMSGVLNMKTKKPRPGQESQTSVGVSLISARAFTLRSFDNDKGSWMVSARRGYLDVLNRLMGNEFKLKPTYYDVMAKVEYDLSKKHTLSGHVFLADDTYKLDEMELEPGITVPNIDFSDTHYGSYYSWLSLTSAFTPSLYARSILYGGLIKQKRFWDNFDNDPKAHFNSGMITDDRDHRLFGFKQDWSFDAADNVFIKFGYDVKRSKVDYTYSKDIQNELLAPNDSLANRTIQYASNPIVKGTQLGFYTSTRFRVLPPLTLEAGLRFDHNTFTHDRLWSPRVNALYALNRKTSLRAGWGYFYQMQEADEMRVQFEETSPFRAQRAEHYVLGVDHQFDNGLYFRTEGYIKKMTRLPATYVTLGADIDEFYPEARDDLVRLTIDDATATGIECYLKYAGEKFSWWVSYVLSKATNDVTAVDFDGKMINQLGRQPRPWDQRHTLNIDAYYRPNKSWQFNLGWQYRSGWSFTDFDIVRLQRPDGTPAYFHDYGVFNGSRYPSYQRLDARINKHFYSSKGKITLFLHVINVLNHTNVSGIDHEFLADGVTTVRQTETWLGITPFVGVIWEF